MITKIEPQQVLYDNLSQMVAVVTETAIYQPTQPIFNQINKFDFIMENKTNLIPFTTFATTEAPVHVIIKSHKLAIILALKNNIKRLI